MAIAELCERLEKMTRRIPMVDIVAEFLVRLEASEIEPAVSMIQGRPLLKLSQRALNVSWATLGNIIMRITRVDWDTFLKVLSKTGDVGAATMEILNNRGVRQLSLYAKPLSIADVRKSFEAIAEAEGQGSKEKKERIIEALLSSASPLEAKYLVKIMIGEMRTGFHEGLMEHAVSKAFNVPLESVQTASMLLGDIGLVAYLAKTEGIEGILKVGFKTFRPVKLMLAQTAECVAEAIREHGGRTAFEFKLDGARVQIHKLGQEVKIYSRRLTDVTKSLPELVEAVKENMQAYEAILEGEVIAVDDNGQPMPFQHLMRRFKRVHELERTAEAVPVKLFLFDILYLNGESLINLSYYRRRQILAEVSGKLPLTEQLVTSDEGEAENFLLKAVESGHEGLMAKKLDSKYTPGIRGKHWLKIKPTLEPLDLVIVAAEYGYGRRHSWLSDYYLAARDAETGEFQVVGKTFKGLADHEITEVTSRLKELAIKEEGRRVMVLPKIVVEVAYNEIQKSQKYKCGLALRFARITRIRYDKAPEEADTIQRVRKIYERQFLWKGRFKAGEHNILTSQKGLNHE
ncbi:MAG: ATP-dependent DNA ligase [Candidatus Bathyarchaeota archaeon]|nr:ATP-dependent DNA ligase [Candidatus Bathyarchaeota archaeon]